MDLWHAVGTAWARAQTVTANDVVIALGGVAKRGKTVTDYIGTLDDAIVTPRRRGKTTAEVWADEAPENAFDSAPSGRLWLNRYRVSSIRNDGAAAFAAGAIAYFGNVGMRFSMWNIAVVALSVLGWILAVLTANGYDRRRLGTGTEEYISILKAGFRIAAGYAVVSYIPDMLVARTFVLYFLPSVLVLTLGARFVQRHLLARRRAQGQALHRTIVVGRVDSVRDMIRNINADPSCGLRVLGACVSGLDLAWEPQNEIEGVPILGSPERALWVVDKMHADAVGISAHPDLVGTALRRLGWALEERNVDLLIEPGIVGVAGPRLSLRPASGLSLLHVERPTRSGMPIRLKGYIDRFVGLCILLAATPLFAVIAAAIKMESRGPVFFRQVRVGEGGATFKMVKFRSMAANAEEMKARLTSDRSEHTLFKMRQDPRITRVGRFIRKYSLDELPQLINVVKGEMSLIGPRPNLPSEVENYEWDAMRRLRARPGMTGLWQVSGRSDLSWEDSVRLDIWYVDNWSLTLDAVILARTFRAVFGGHGAY